MLLLEHCRDCILNYCNRYSPKHIGMLPRTRLVLWEALFPKKISGKFFQKMPTKHHKILFGNNFPFLEIILRQNKHTLVHKFCNYSKKTAFAYLTFFAPYHLKKKKKKDLVTIA